MRRRTVRWTTSVAATGTTAVLLVACGGAAPAGPATVSGVVGGEAVEGSGPSLVQASDDYYEGMSLLTEETVVLDEAGDEAEASILVEGTEVDVWTGDACAESDPVQCGVEVVQLVG